MNLPSPEIHHLSFAALLKIRLFVLMPRNSRYFFRTLVFCQAWCIYAATTRQFCQTWCNIDRTADSPFLFPFALLSTNPLLFCGHSLSNILLKQRFPTCGTRTTSGARRSSRWYASNFHFFSKTWIHSFLVYVSGFVSE